MRMDPIRVNVYRNKTVESHHLVDVIVTDDQGRPIEIYGDVEKPTYARSMIKPIQAIPFVLSGAPYDAPDLLKAVAVSCASHSSEHLHVDFLKLWHEKLGIVSEHALACGPQTPDDDTVYHEIVRDHEKPKRINNNCSGKHTGMIATAIKLGIPYQGYEQYDHPIQVEVRKHLSLHSGVDHSSIPWGLDGCGIPTYAAPQTAIAQMMSAMHGTSKSVTSNPDEKAALALIREALTKNPYMYGGHDWADSELTSITEGRIFAKIGAEGNYAVLLYNEGKTMVLKARDGNSRATEAVIADLLDKHAQLRPGEREQIRAHACPIQKNHGGTPVGHLEVELP